MVSYSTCMIQMPLMIREPKGVRITNTTELANMCSDMIDFSVETVHVISVNTKNQLIDRVVVCIGLVDSCLIHLREVFRAAVMANACSIHIVHNHPSGDPSPSVDDLKITRQLIEAGNVLGIKVLDHVIVGHDDNWNVRFFSFQESGLCQF